QKEIIKAKYTAAEAEVRIKESVTGISEEMADVGMAIQRAEEKTEQMKARAMALDELMDSGVLTDYTTNKDMIERELQDVMMRDAVEKELERLRKEMGKGEVKEAQKVKRGKKGSEVSTEAEAETETNSS
ncbi:MAG: hypothetical protein QW319_02645, partial [Candidatus Nitrosocaldus sp.]